MRAAIYARLSKRNEVNAPNLDDQVTRCRELADTRGWVVVDTLTDYGESAYNRDNIEDRPAFADLLAGIRSKRYDALIAWRPDRLWRDPIEAAIVMRLCVKAGVQTVATVTEGDRDPANPGDEMVATIIAAVGRYESAAKAARVRAKKRQHAEQGRPSGGTIAFGYLTPERDQADPTIAARFSEAIEAVIVGASIRSVANGWNAAGFTSRDGRPWSPANVRRQLTEPYMAGHRVHQGRIIGVGTWAPLVPPDRWLLAQDVITDPRRRTNSNGREYMLTRGLAVCGLCSAALVARPRNDGRRAYVCAAGTGFHGCGKIGSLAEPLEADVEARLWGVIDADELVTAEPEPAPVVTLADLDAVERRLTDLARDHYVLAVIGRDEYLAARVPLADEADRIRRLLVPRPQPAALTPDDLRRDWPQMGLRARGDAIAAFVEAVVVGPGVRGRTAYDPERVTLRWRA
jgi:site-specific DNA recombinase